MCFQEESQSDSLPLPQWPRDTQAGPFVNSSHTLSGSLSGTESLEILCPLVLTRQILIWQGAWGTPGENAAPGRSSLPDGGRCFRPWLCSLQTRLEITSVPRAPSPRDLSEESPQRTLRILVKYNLLPLVTVNVPHCLMTLTVLIFYSKHEILPELYQVTLCVGYSGIN